MKCTLQELKKLSNQISKRLTAGVSIYLTGNLGSGKTTFTKFLVSELFKKNKKKKPEVTSPTFNIVQYYKVNTKLIIAHYDLYRLKSTRDLNHIGLYDFEDSLLSIIEWPRLIKKKIKIVLKLNLNIQKKKMKEMSKLNILEKLKSDIFLIAGDASPRKFFRFRNNKKHILVYCEKDKRNNLENYIKINNFLIKKKIKVPKIIKKNIKKNFVIIEDFGNKLLKNQIENNRKKINFFKKIIDELIRLQNIKLSKILPKYSMILLTKELNLFYDWYLPEFFSKKKIRKIKRDINSILINYLKKTVKLNNVFVHRDFHIENLILHKSKIGFLDTQDAVIGHAAYDLMSLIDDVRIYLKKNEQEKIYNYYVKKVKNIDKDFDFHFHILSIQRLLKILGIFVRLFRRDGKKKYLKFIARTWKLIDLRLNYKEFKFLKLSFNKYFTKKIKNKKWK